jgi:hypothetical protein
VAISRFITRAASSVAGRTFLEYVSELDAQCPSVDGPSGRAAASPAIEAGKGHQRQGARHVSESPISAFAVIGIDIGKSSSQVVGLDGRGRATSKVVALRSKPGGQ